MEPVSCFEGLDLSALRAFGVVFGQTSDLEDLFPLLPHQRNRSAGCMTFPTECTFSFFPNFVAKTQNPSVCETHFEEFTVPSLADLVDDDRDEMLLCPMRALKKYKQDRAV